MYIILIDYTQTDIFQVFIYFNFERNNWSKSTFSWYSHYMTSSPCLLLSLLDHCFWSGFAQCCFCSRHIIQLLSGRMGSCLFFVVLLFSTCLLFCYCSGYDPKTRVFCVAAWVLFQTPASPTVQKMHLRQIGNSKWSSNLETFFTLSSLGVVYRTLRKNQLYLWSTLKQP